MGVSFTRSLDGLDRSLIAAGVTGAECGALSGLPEAQMWLSPAWSL